MAGEVVVDALPYIDQGYDEPGVREAALAMVEEECRRYRPTKNYLDVLPPLNITAFETTMMHAEFERLQNRQPMETMSMKRYELPPPPAGKLNELSAWTECVDNSQAQLEHQAVRILNLQLMLEYCCPAWQHYLQALRDVQKLASKKLSELRQLIQEVNWQRKSLQIKGGEDLRGLESKWVALVSHNYEIEQACSLAEEYIGQHQQHLSAVLSSNSNYVEEMEASQVDEDSEIELTNNVDSVSREDIDNHQQMDANDDDEDDDSSEEN